MDSDNHLRLGIIGCGELGRVHARRFAAIPGVEVTSLSDPSNGAMDVVASELPSPPQRHLNFQDVIEADLDAVCIASPDAFHVQQVLAALRAGLHVLCEKPLTPYVDQLEAVIAAHDQAAKHVALTYPRRYDAGMRRLREEIRSGRYGEVRTITAYNAEDWISSNRGTWRHDPEITPGGFFYDASGHQLDTIFWTTGLTGQSVQARSDNCGMPVPMKVWGTAELSNGSPLTFCFVGDGHIWREQINIHCERADFAILNAKAYIVEERGPRAESAGIDTRPTTLDSRYHALAPDEEDETADACFVTMIRGGGPNWSPLSDVRPVVRFTEAALRSAETAKKCEVAD